MKRRLAVLRLAAALTMVGGALGMTGISRGQYGSVPTTETALAEAAAVDAVGAILNDEGGMDRGGGGLRWVGEGGGGGMDDRGTSLSDAIRAAAAAYRKAEGEDAKAAAQTKLAELLGKYFDQDMARRQADVKKIEDRLTKLRALLERRLAKKQEIVGLQTKVVLNEADGLGFYESTPTAQLNPVTGAYSPWQPTPSSDQDPFGFDAQPTEAAPWNEGPPANEADPFGGATPVGPAAYGATPTEAP